MNGIASIDPDAPEALYSQGCELLKTKRLPEALQVLQRCLDRLAEFTLVSSLLVKEHRRANNLDLNVSRRPGGRS